MHHKDDYTEHIHQANLLPFVTMVWGKLPSINSALLSALVDRWRPEKHTFHFPSGEMIVTLRDVQMILALPITRNAITGNTDTTTCIRQTKLSLGAWPPGWVGRKAARHNVEEEALPRNDD